MTTRAERIERSRRRNRKRGITRADVAALKKATGPPNDYHRRAAAAGPRWRHRGEGGPMYDAWGGENPPAA